MAQLKGYEKAVATDRKLRVLLQAVSGGGKTLTALLIAQALEKLENAGPIVVIDTEFKSSAWFADIVPHYIDIMRGDFHPLKFIEAIKKAEEAGASVVITDSLSSAYSGYPNGVCDLADQWGKKPGFNDYSKWKIPKLYHKQLYEYIKTCSIHFIGTAIMESKRVMDRDSNTGKTTLKDVGEKVDTEEKLLKYFDFRMEMSKEHDLFFQKSRVLELDNQVVSMPDAKWCDKFVDLAFNGTQILEKADGEEATMSKAMMPSDMYKSIWAKAKAKGCTAAMFKYAVVQMLGYPTSDAIPMSAQKALEDLVSSKELLANISETMNSDPSWKG